MCDQEDEVRDDLKEKNSNWTIEYLIYSKVEAQDFPIEQYSEDAETKMSVFWGAKIKFRLKFISNGKLEIHGEENKM